MFCKNINSLFCKIVNYGRRVICHSVIQQKKIVMEDNYIFISLFILSIIIRFLLNISKFYYLKKVLKKQEIYIQGQFEESTESQKEAAGKAGDWVQENQIEIKKVVLNTGVQDQKQSYMKPLGLGYTKEQSISALDNLLLLNSDIMGKSIEIMKRAKGYYKVQALKSFNPLFWIEFIIFFPKELSKYFGIDEEKKYSGIIVKIIQVLYWLISIYFMYQSYIQTKL
ncbi:MAG: hypothetical protein IPM32_02320 [Ignavibacteriae bacterium]|nr:hypothetical protein [Ignavibacteriota bacterium]